MPTEQVNFQIDTTTKQDAEAVFSRIGLTATEAVRLFYTQVALRQRLPFDVTIPPSDEMKRFEEELDASIAEHYTTLERLAQK